MSCSGGRLCFRVCSASSASLVHVRAMFLRMACTRGFAAPSANFSHSAARSLQSSEFNTGIPSIIRTVAAPLGFIRLYMEYWDHFQDRLRVQPHKAELDRVRRMRPPLKYSTLGVS